MMMTHHRSPTATTSCSPPAVTDAAGYRGAARDNLSHAGVVISARRRK